MKIVPWERQKRAEYAKMLLLAQKLFGERLFFVISSPTTPTFGVEKHWLLVIEDRTGYVWSFVSKEKLDLARAMMGLVKHFKTKYCMQVQYLHSDNAGDNVALKKAFKQ